eukprot:6537909-Prorocentrum_lima.AAC.1
MHPSMWLIIKGKKPLQEVTMAQPVPADKLAETHTWIKGQIEGKIALFVDDMTCCKPVPRQAMWNS